jgi:hypothetical protein
MLFVEGLTFAGKLHEVCMVGLVLAEGVLESCILSEKFDDPLLDDIALVGIGFILFETLD